MPVDRRWLCAIAGLAIGVSSPEAGRALSRPEAGPPAATAAVSGVVTDAATGESIQGAVVAIRRLGVQSSVREQVTDARGRFVFDELPPSTQYVLNAMKPGFASAEYRRLPGQPPGTVFALADGQWLRTANLAMSRLGAIGGVVTDEFGEPVVGAFVRAVAEISVGGRRVLAAGPVARTDDRGEYRLAGLLAGRYLVMLPSVQHSVPASTSPAQIEGLREDMYERLEAAIARNPATPRLNKGAVGDGSTRLIIGNFVAPPASADGRERAYPATFFPSTTTIASASSIDLAPGEDRSGMSFTIQPVPVVRVAGRLDGMTTPARLTLRLIPAGLEQLSTGGEAASTIVNTDGAFTFLSVPAGSYTLEARQSQFEFTLQPVFIPNSPSLPSTPGRELLGSQLVSSFAGGPMASGYSAKLNPPGTGYYGNINVNVGSEDIDNLVVPIRSTVTIRGRYVYEDGAKRPSGRGLPVIAEPIEHHAQLGMASSRENAGSPDASGDGIAFTIPAVVPGTYNLRVTPGPSAGFVVKSIVIAGRDYLKMPLEIQPARDIDNVVVTFTGKPAALSGSVRTGQEQPADGAAVVVFTTDRSVWPALGLTPVLARVVTASADGTFSVPTLPAGEYHVLALSEFPADWTDPAFLARAAVAATRASLEWGISKSVNLVATTVK
jgi:hypothetical protein